LKTPIGVKQPVFAVESIDKFRDSNYSIRKITSDFDKENNVSDGTGLYIFKYLLASKHIYIDMNESIEVKSKIVCKLPRLLNSSQPDTQ
jgi:hypothetical protein